MKKISIILTTIASLLIMCSSCGYNEFPNPPEVTPDTLQVTHSIKELKNLYKGAGTTIHDSIVVAGKVTSSDRAGNFYKGFVIQDETGGIEIKVESFGLYNYYRRGQLVYLKCAGLTLGAYAETVSIGVASKEEKYENNYIPYPLKDQFIARGPLLSPVEPQIVSIPEINKDMTYMLVTLNDVQFVSSEANAQMTYALEKINSNRHIEDKNGNQLIVRTSGYADFALKQLPKGSGSITGIITFFKDDAQLTLITDNDVHMTNPRF